MNYDVPELQAFKSLFSCRFWRSGILEKLLPKELEHFLFLFAEYFYVLDSVQLFTCKAVDISYYLHETEENIGSQRG